MRKVFGESVRNRRNQLGFSQEKLAERADLHRTYVSDVERGARNVSLEIIQRLAEALEVSVRSLFPNTSNGTKQPRELVDVLLVEDNADDVAMTLNAFRQARFINRVDVVGDGEEALDYLFCRGRFVRREQGVRPQIVLLDLNLPKLSGLEVLKRIKANKAMNNVEVVVLTISNDDENISECERLGARAYITKPVNFQKLSQATPRMDLTWALLTGSENSRQRAQL